MNQVLIFRTQGDDRYTIGDLYVRCNKEIIFQCKTIERGWLDNQQNISCIPDGVYDLQLEYSPRFRKKLWEIYGVPGRSECKFHAANYARQLNGCIALGRNHKDIDGDRIPDVTSSRLAMGDFHNAMGDGPAELQIISLYDSQMYLQPMPFA